MSTTKKSATTRAHWSSRVTFVFAAAGSAIGLGNLWKFPYIAGENGGGAFVLIYLGCIALVALPILIAEIFLGQQSQKNAVQAFESLDKKNSMWTSVGWMGLFSAVCILSFYSVVGGWVFDYAFRGLTNQFASNSESTITGFAKSLTTNSERELLWHTIFMATTCFIVGMGLKAGLERLNKILMPALLVILGILLVQAVFLPGFGKSITYLFSPNADKLTKDGILEALGHSFFTLSLGMGTMLTYGSYLSKKENVVKTAFAVAFMDTMIALVAGVVIFSIVFTFNSNPDAGTRLMFQTLPILFSKMTGGGILAFLFFLLVSVAALTSAISLLEVIVAYFVDAKKYPRPAVTAISGLAIYVVGVLICFDVTIGSTSIFGLLDKLTSSYTLPVGGIFIALFYGWVLGPKAAQKTLEQGREPSFFATGLLWTARVVAPALVIAMMYNQLVG